VSWALPLLGLLIALLVLLPCGSPANAAAPAQPSAGASDRTAPAAQRTEHAEHTERDRLATTTAAHPRPADSAPLPTTWCASDRPGPVPGHGCSSHSSVGQDAQLPNAPPQPGAADPPLLVAPSELPAATPVHAAARPAPAPDLHLLQVNRP
jgi:hypothetical protein